VVLSSVMSSGSTGGVASPPVTGPGPRRRSTGTRQQLPHLQVEIIRRSEERRRVFLSSLASFHLRSLHVRTRPRTSADLMVGTQLRRLLPLARARGEHRLQPRDPIGIRVDERTSETRVERRDRQAGSISNGGNRAARSILSAGDGRSGAAHARGKVARWGKGQTGAIRRSDYPEML
jgi:hypothetical protein